MWLAALVLQASLFARPLHLADEPPELRSAQHILLLYEGADAPYPPGEVSREKASAFAAQLVRRLRDGADFTQVARETSMARGAKQGALLGTFTRGSLSPDLEEFLFSAHPGDVSDPIVDWAGVHVLKCVETFAGALQILVEGTSESSRARALELVAQLDGGADFGAVARASSDDRESAEADGQYWVFERGSGDSLLARATFAARPGEVVGPIESSLGFHILKRVSPDEIDPALHETSLVRARALLIAFRGANGADARITRTEAEARVLAAELHARLLDGADMAHAARESNDDPGGRDRAGDLGWIYRGSPGLTYFTDRLFTKPVGWTSEPLLTPAGYLILRRER